MKRRDFLKLIPLAALSPIPTLGKVSDEALTITVDGKKYPIYPTATMAKGIANRTDHPQFCDCPSSSIKEQLATGPRPMAVYFMTVFPHEEGVVDEVHISSVPVGSRKPATFKSAKPRRSCPRPRMFRAEARA